MSKLSPIVSEFDTAEDERAYQSWFEQKVNASIADVRPASPHAKVMAELDRIIEQAENTSSKP